MVAEEEQEERGEDEKVNPDQTELGPNRQKGESVVEIEETVVSQRKKLIMMTTINW